MHRLLFVGIVVVAAAMVIPRALLPAGVAKSAPDAELMAFATVPPDATAGEAGFIMKVYGNGFPADRYPNPPVFVVWNGVPIPAIMKSSTELHVEISRELLANRGSATVGVLLQGVGGPSAVISNPFRIWRSSSDANCDSVVTAEDALFILRDIASASPAPHPCSSDANNDGIIDVADAMWARSEVAGLINQLRRSTTQ